MPSGQLGGEPSIIAAVAMCGPGTRPLETSTRCPMVSDIAVRLKICVTPLARYGVSKSSSCISPSGTVLSPDQMRISRSFSRCMCISVNPGMRNLPRPSIRLAPRGVTVRAGPMDAMRPSRMVTVAFEIGAPSTVIGNSVTCSITSSAARSAANAGLPTGTDSNANMTNRRGMIKPRKWTGSRGFRRARCAAGCSYRVTPSKAAVVLLVGAVLRRECHQQPQQEERPRIEE
jgi:hypothetical protein